MSGYMTEKQRQEALTKPKLIVRSTCDAFCYQYRGPNHFAVIEARGIKAADLGGTSDPFVELRIKGQTHSFKTQTIKVIRLLIVRFPSLTVQRVENSGSLLERGVHSPP